MANDYSSVAVPFLVRTPQAGSCVIVNEAGAAFYNCSRLT
jgi:hypothetical protein